MCNDKHHNQIYVYPDWCKMKKSLSISHVSPLKPSRHVQE